MAKTIKMRLAYQSEKPAAFRFLGTHFFIYPGPKWTTLDQAVGQELKRQFPTWLEVYSKPAPAKAEPAQP